MTQNGSEKNPDSGRKPLEVEIINPEDHDYRESSSQRMWQARYGNQGGFSGYWSASSFDSNGCLAPAITFAIFMLCLGQYGLLAAIGFLVFYVFGSILGTLHSARRLMRGMPVYPWLWRTCNWTASFVFTVWLAGGFQS